MSRYNLFYFLIALMFSTVTKAFITTPFGARTIVARSMSTTAGEGSIVDRCKAKISEALETDDVVVTGAYDDPNGSHISVKVVSSKFEGKRAMQRQQMVYKALWDELKGPVHAVDAMICKTPNEE